MRRVFGTALGISALCVVALLSPGVAAPAAKLEINSREAALKWIGLYRAKPQPARVPGSRFCKGWAIGG